MKAGALTLACAVVLTGCGGSQHKPAAAGPSPTPAERVVSQEKGMALPLGTNQSRAIKDLGEPAAVLEAKPFRCFVYKTDGSPDTWLRMCFKDDKMTGIGTITGRANAMTLSVPEPKGNGRLKKPKTNGGSVPVRTPTP